jgi:carbonic anhydrase/acetyltransferase-like protein (isoleucine patch superfamily)
VTIGDNCSVQDGAVIHVDEDAPTVIGNQVTIGHGAIVHGCEIGDNVLIGIRSVVLSGAQIASNCIIGACTLITEGMRIPANSLVVGTPGKVIKTVTVEHERHLRYMWEEYVSLSRAYKDARCDLDRLSPGAL